MSMMEQAISTASTSDSSHAVRDVAFLGMKRSAARRAVHVFKYLVDNPHGADVTELRAYHTTANEDMEKPSQEILEILVAHGWDINKHDGSGWTLLWSVVRYPELVRWCLDHGAKVDIPEAQPEVIGTLQKRTGAPRKTILGMAASYGSIETLELLGSKGAPLDPRTLHGAVYHATASAPREGSEPDPYYTEIIDMIRHLIDVVKLDVNAIEHELGSSCSTPLCIVAGRPTNQLFRELVYVLLDRGADPNLNCHRTHVRGWPSAMVCGQTNGNGRFLQAVKEWQAEKQAEKQGGQVGDID